MCARRRRLPDALVVGMAAPEVRLATAVVGAGPAGLLFCLIGRVLHPGPDWQLALLDKRASYARTHRLRMAPAPYRAIRDALRDPRFDAFLVFLEEHAFAPAVNELEDHLAAAVAATGTPRHTFEVRPDTPMREILAPLGAADRYTVVGADSVHSAVRAIVGAPAPRRATHQTVARLRIEGPGLPPALGVVDRVRLSKLLRSVVDYRLNPGGWAEFDLFLAGAEHAAADALHASPREPIPLNAAQLSRLTAPLFRRIVSHLARGFGSGPCAIALVSTFRLEQAVAPVRAFTTDEADVFLVGDAAVSLPFFRGMACLAACAAALAHAHVDRLGAHATPDVSLLAEGRPLVVGGRPLPGQILEVATTTWRGQPAQVVLHRWFWRYGVHVMAGGGTYRSVYRLAWIDRATAREAFRAQADPVLRYDAEVGAIVAGELRIVTARARLLAGVREFVRVTALLPFPIQAWFLTTGPPPGRDRATPGLGLNLLIAAPAAVAAITGFPAVACALQAVGGVVYHAALVFEPGPHRYVRRVWEVQVAGLLAGGLYGLSVGRWWLGLAWAVLAFVFVVGLLTFEALVGRWYDRASLEE